MCVCRCILLTNTLLLYTPNTVAFLERSVASVMSFIIIIKFDVSGKIVMTCLWSLRI